MLLHYGFEKPTPEIMAAWGKWFGSIADKTVENGGFHGAAREISQDGTQDLPMGMDSIRPRALKRPKRSHEATRSLRASASTKSWPGRPFLS
jgi:hypothetical protein